MAEGWSAGTPSADRGEVSMNRKPIVVEGLADVLLHVVERAQRAPSLLNTQPWRWHLLDDGIELYADHDRQIRSIDPQARLLTLSCGAALHHARVTLAGFGFEPRVERLLQGDLLARVLVGARRDPEPEQMQMVRNILTRRSDRRPFVAVGPIPDPALARMRRAAEAEHGRLHRVGEEHLSVLIAAVDLAAATEVQLDDYQAELFTWTSRPRGSGVGVPPETIVPQVPRRVAVRDFAPIGEIVLNPGGGDDRSAQYLIVATPTDSSTDWLMAGEATSAAWLVATEEGLTASAMSDVVEIPQSRTMLAQLLDPPGFPQLVLRVGIDLAPTPAPNTPRRHVAEVVDDHRRDST
jgi:nitroreductase